MLDFSAVKAKQVSMNEFASSLSIDDMREFTNETVEKMISLIEQCSDSDIIFVPDDPEANDVAACNPHDRTLAWTIGHNVVHATASAEEYAFSAAELARGVEFHGRSRSEVPWQAIQTVEQCLHRLEESRRMRLASLEMWPDDPNLDIGYLPWRESGFVNAKGIFTWGLAHDTDHNHQIRKILEQARNK
ncbi:MAG: DinB family protein [Anaerolineae bacterium]